MANFKKLTREDYKKLIMGKSKKSRGRKLKSKKSKKMRGGLIIPDLLLAKLISSENRNRMQRQAVIDSMNKVQMAKIGRVIRKFVNSQYNLSPSQLKALTKNRAFLKALMTDKVPLETKKRILTQKGGFLGALLPIAVNAIAGPVAGLLKKIF